MTSSDIAPMPQAPATPVPPSGYAYASDLICCSGKAQTGNDDDDSPGEHDRDRGFLCPDRQPFGHAVEPLGLEHRIHAGKGVNRAGAERQGDCESGDSGNREKHGDASGHAISARCETTGKSRQGGPGQRDEVRP